MQNAVPVGRGSMIAILGMKNKEITDLLESRKDDVGVCEIANDNADGQVIVSGNKESINSLKDLLTQKIKSIPLKVSAPFHCSLMRPAAESMKDKIFGTKFDTPFLEIVNNVTAKPESEPKNIKKLLVDQIFSTVKWRESLIEMNKTGVKNFIEIGPGKALSGMVKRTLKEVNSFSINSNLAILKNFKNGLKNKKVLITGATGGIGNSLVKKFDDLGSKILATGTNQEKLDNLKKISKYFRRKI